MLHDIYDQPTAYAAIQRYLHDTLGTVPEVRAWPGAEKLPYYLQDAFDVVALTLFDRLILLAVDKRPEKPGLANLRTAIDKLRHVTGIPVVYVSGALASYERKRLVEQKVPFLVPGNQLYLPELGIDLREFFRRIPPATAASLSPATQAMLIAVLLREPWQPEWQPAEVIGALGYTTMTLSRAVRELTAAGVVTLRTEGRTRWLRTDRSAPEMWEHAKPLLRSPVKRRFWALPIEGWAPPRVRWAGLSALARLSMLAEPRYPTYAIGQAQWKIVKQGRIETVPEPLPGTCEWELWHYDPALVPGSDTVDPLSLTLSLEDNTDERVQLALDGLKERFPW